jgi:aminopeptidase YwaD
LTGFGSGDVLIAKINPLITETSNFEMINDILIYPNPSTDNFIVDFENEAKKVELSISDITGKIIYSIQCSQTRNMEVDTKEFANGIYFLHLKTEKENITKKIIIQK